MATGRVSGMNASGKFGTVASDDGRAFYAPRLPPGLEVGTRVEFDPIEVVPGTLNAMNVVVAKPQANAVAPPCNRRSGPGAGIGLGFGIITPIDEGDGLFHADDAGGWDFGM